jgi:hypothetical protein
MGLTKLAVLLKYSQALRLTRFPSQVGQEVDDQVEEDRVDNLVWQIGKHRSESLSRRVVAKWLDSSRSRVEGDSQSVLNMFLDNISLGVQGQDLKSGTKGVKQDGKEECSTSRSERVGRLGWFRQQRSKQ